MEVTPGVCETSIEQLCELFTFFVGKSGVVAIALGILEVYFLMGHVHVAADNDGLLLVEGKEIVAEVVVPCHAIVESPQFVL